jgi:hypothetical protein
VFSFLGCIYVASKRRDSLTFRPYEINPNELGLSEWCKNRLSFGQRTLPRALSFFAAKGYLNHQPPARRFWVAHNFFLMTWRPFELSARRVEIACRNYMSEWSKRLTTWESANRVERLCILLLRFLWRFLVSLDSVVNFTQVSASLIGGYIAHYSR